MSPNPPLGVLFHWAGGLASASFYVPYKAVQRWPWEVYWVVGGFVSWIVAPWAFAAWATPDLIGLLLHAPTESLALCLGFGALWGVGALTFGMAVRFLGVSLGMAMPLGITAVVGTLTPPIVDGSMATLLRGPEGPAMLIGLALCVAGIAAVGRAGLARDRESSPGEQGAEYDFGKGLLVAVLSGVLSSCFAFGLAAGEPIRRLMISEGGSPLWQGLPVLVVILLGGFATNLVWCLTLTLRSGSARTLVGQEPSGGSIPLARNYALCGLAGLAWYLQFFFYTMGASQMGPFGFSSWTIHMASIIIFSCLWGLALREWTDASASTRRVLLAGVGLLVASTAVIGYGNYLAVAASAPAGATR